MYVAPLIRPLSFAIVLALLTSLGFVGHTLAQNDSDEGNITVQANVEALPSITLEFCDDTDVQFGSNLNARGQESDSSDNVTALSGGEAVGAFYGWAPTCTTGPSKLLRVTSTVAWSGGVCIANESGTSSLNDDGNDLRWSRYTPETVGGYSGVLGNSEIFQVCSTETPPDWSLVLCACNGAGTHEINAYFYLQVDWDEEPGSYSATTVWSVEV